MPKIILASRYLKNASSEKLFNLMQYIGSREGVEFNKIKFDPNALATQKQKDFIKQLHKDFDGVENLLEYEDYINKPTAENASELITSVIEQNVDIAAGKDNFVRYMGMRPNVEKVGSHGLFSQYDTPISLNAIAGEVADHSGNVWSHVLSLRREDAERLSFNNQSVFKTMLRNKVVILAEAHKIPIENLKWYAAFHNESHHPHIHLIVYSDDVNKGYLTNFGIDTLKSTFTGYIFKDELQHLYEEQTDVRNALRNEARDKAAQLISDINNSACENKQVERLILKLNNQLKTVNGKTVYGYLPKAIKATVNDIVRELASDERIAELYKTWYELDKEKLKNYTDKIPDDVPLENQKEFTSIKNSIIQAALNLNSTLNDVEFKNAENESDNSDPEPDFDKPFWEKAGFKEYKLGKELLYGISETQEIEKGLELLKKSASLEFNTAGYLLGKTYFKGEYVQQDIWEAIKWFKQSAEENNSYAAFKLGKIYSNGKDIKTDLLVAEKWLKVAVNSNSHYAQYALGMLYLKDELYKPQEALSLLHKAAHQNNQYALLKLGRIYLTGKLVPENVEHAVMMLERSAQQDNSYAEYALGKLYLYGKDVPKDIEKALCYLNRSAEHKNIYAKQLLDKYENTPLPSSFGTVMGLFQQLVGMFKTRMDLHHNQHDTDSKLLSVIAKKKAALGNKSGQGNHIKI